MSIQILYEDEHLIALSKPSGQVVIPGRGNLPGLALIQELDAHLGKKAFVVHRLDRGASGIVLFAKDAPTHRNLSLQFEHHLAKKTYLVLIQGRLETSGHIDQPIRSFGSGRMGIHPQGKPSTTDYAVRKLLDGSTLLEVTTQSGRRHQIRVHLHSIGHPVMGDALYGTDRPVGGASRLMLHAWKLEIKKTNDQILSLTDEPPALFFDYNLASMQPE